MYIYTYICIYVYINHAHERITSHIWMSHVTHIKESWHTPEWVKSQGLFPQHADANTNETCHAHEWVMVHLNKSRRIPAWVMSHASGMTFVSCHTQTVTSHSHEWVMSHMGMSCHMQMSHVTLTWMSHVAGAIFAARGIHAPWVMSRIWMSHVTHVNESCHTYKWVTSHI